MLTIPALGRLIEGKGRRGENMNIAESEVQGHPLISRS